MAAIEPGKDAVKLRGRKAGQKVKVVRVIDKNFVEVEYPNGKKKKCNASHLEPLAG